MRSYLLDVLILGFFPAIYPSREDLILSIKEYPGS